MQLSNPLKLRQISAEDRLQHCQEGAWTNTQAAVQGNFPYLKDSLFTLLSSNRCRKKPGGYRRQHIMWKAKGIKRSNSCQLFFNAPGLHLLHCAQTSRERGEKADTTSSSTNPIRTNRLLNREILNSGSSGKNGIRLCLYLHLSQRATFPVLQTPQEGVIRFFLH